MQISCNLALKLNQSHQFGRNKSKMSDLHKKSDGAAGVKPTEIATVFSYHMVDLMFSKMGKVSFNPVCLMYEKKKRRKILFVSSEPNTRST